MNAMHGGQATNDTIDAHTMAVLLRGGMLPRASGDPAERRATRDLWRRRMSRMRQRAALLTHVQQTNRQDHLPHIGKQLADKANREGGAAHCPAPAVPRSLAGDRAVLNAHDRPLTERERSRVNTAQAHKAQLFYRLRAIPGVGKLLALGWLDAIHDSQRLPRVQAFVSYGRLVNCAEESAGQR